MRELARGEILPYPPPHNSPHWLEVVWLDERRAGRNHGLMTIPAGWFVRRRCPCHAGEVVSVALPSQMRARRCIEVMDDVSRRLGHDH
jgi:hypothetical protein